MMQMSHDNNFAIAVLGAMVCAAIGLFVVLDQRHQERTPPSPIQHESPEFVAADYYDH